MQTLTNYEDCLERVQTESTVPKNCIKVNKYHLIYDHNNIYNHIIPYNI